jgi:hypothetical protein
MESRAPNQSSRSSASPTSSQSSSPEPDPIIAVVARLKELAHQASAARVPYPDDTSDHYQTFSRAVFNLLSTDLALFTFAQIVDGLPTTDVAWDRRLPGISDDDHPIEGHPSLCPGVMERTREIRDQVNLSILLFNPLVCFLPSRHADIFSADAGNSSSELTVGLRWGRRPSKFGSSS